MNAKVIDLNKSVFELCSDYPELTALLASIGFQDITKPGMLAMAGRLMTIPKGAAMKKIDLDSIKETLSAHGYQVR